MTIRTTFISHHCKAQCAPNPAYPNGIDVDLSEGSGTYCKAKLPYPAECCGVIVAICDVCGASAGITTAGRPDDPRTVTFACKGRKQ
jgi:hypothetical protein